MKNKQHTFVKEPFIISFERTRQYDDLVWTTQCLFRRRFKLVIAAKEPSPNEFFKGVSSLPWLQKSHYLEKHEFHHSFIKVYLSECSQAQENFQRPFDRLVIELYIKSS